MLKTDFHTQVRDNPQFKRKGFSLITTHLT